VAKPIQDQISSKSPWNTQVVVDNQCTTPVRVYLARDPERPTVKDSVEHSVPPQQAYAIHSGWMQEPLATLILRTGIHEAKVFRMPHMTQLKIELAPSGLKVTSTDPMIVEDYQDPGSVPNNDTVPMVLRGESFMDRKPGSQQPRGSVARQVVSDWKGEVSPSGAAKNEPPPQFAFSQHEDSDCVLKPVVHGKPAQGDSETADMDI